MGTEARTRVALAGIAAAIILALAQVFSSGPWIGPVFLAAVLAGALSAGARRLGLGLPATTALALVALLEYLVLVFQAARSWYGLPSTDALTGLARAAARAYEHSRVDYAPVPLRPGYLILTVGAIWAVVVWAEIAAFRWRAPVVAASPATALFALLLVVGTGSGTTLLVTIFLTSLFLFWSSERAGSLAAWGNWLTRRPEGPRLPGIVAGLARRMVVACVAGALVVPLAVPALGRGLVSWRTGMGEGGAGGGGGPGDGGRGLVDPLVQLAPRLISQTDDVLFRVRADRAAYWRLLSLTRFDGNTWLATPAARVTAESGTDFVLNPGDGRHRDLIQEVQVEALRTPYLPAAATPLQIRLTHGAVRVHPHTQDLAYEGELAPGLAYIVTSSIPVLDYDDLIDARPSRRDDAISQEYFQLPEEIHPEVERIAHEWTDALDKPGEKLVALQQRLRGFDYELPTAEQVAEGQSVSSDEYLARWLTEIRAGYCQQFATAFALLARVLGYPARVSVGFLPGEADAATGADYTVRGTYAHAWPEVHIQGYGWVPFEPTPREEAATPDYTLSPFARELAAAPNFQAPDAALFGAALGVRGLADPRLAGAGRAGRGGGGGGVDDRRGDPVANAWTEAFDRVALTLLLLVAVAALGIPALKAVRRRRRYARAATPAEVAAAAFADFHDLAAVLENPRPPAESPRSYARRVAAARRLPPRDAMGLADIFEAARFAAAPLPQADAAAARTLTRSLRRGLWDGATWIERGIAVFSVRGLLGGAGAAPRLRRKLVPQPRLDAT